MNHHYTIPIPTDNGFIGNTCNSIECKKYFKISSAEDEVYCPYCGTKQESEVNDYVTKVASEKAFKYVNDEFDKMLKNVEFGSKGLIKVKTGNYRERQYIPPKLEEVDTEIECFQCNKHYQVFGIVGFCPYCRSENISIYDTDISIIRKKIDSEHNSNKELRHAYSDLVSVFELFCQKRNPKKIGVNFQSLRNTKQFFRKEYSLDINKGLSDAERLTLKRLFMKRHVYIHAGGVIGEEYIKEVPQDKKLLGTKAVLSLSEFDKGVDILRKVITNILSV